MRVEGDSEPKAMSPSQAQTTISHFSHPHPLQLINHQNPQISATCSGCKLQATGLIYSCTTCNYFLHTKCSKMPNKITHPCDEGHVLSLLPKPLYEEGFFNCDACGKQGQGFCYNCKICKIDLHILCAAMPQNFTHQSHCHQLKLNFSPPHPTKIFNCDICHTPGSNHWLYRCDSCDFDVHLNCSKVPAKPVKQTNMHQNQTNFTPFPNQTPIPQPQALNMQQPGFTHSRSSPEVPPQAPNYHPFNQPYAATGIPVNHGIHSPALSFMQTQNNDHNMLLQAILANAHAQQSLNQQYLQALLAGGGVGGIGGRNSNLGGMQQLIQAFSGLGNAAGGNLPGMNLFANGDAFSGLGNAAGGNTPGMNLFANGDAGSNLLQGILGGDGGLSILNGLDLGGLLGGFSF